MSSATKCFPGQGLRFRGVVFCFFFLIGMLSLLCPSVQALTIPPDSCDSLIGLKFHDTLPAEEQKYLGIFRMNPFSLKGMQGTLFVIEVFSTYCTTCPRDIPVVNEVYSSVRNDPGLKDHVRVFSIAIGNNRTEAEKYGKELKVQYPVLTDYNFAAHEVLGNPRVPYTLVIRKTSRGRCTVEYSHQGVLPSADLILNVLQSCMP